VIRDEGKRGVANKVRGGTAEPAEVTCTAGADGDRAGLVACGGPGERNARVDVADPQRVVDTVIGGIPRAPGKLAAGVGRSSSERSAPGRSGR
jgi:hypothetical protein